MFNFLSPRSKKQDVLHHYKSVLLQTNVTGFGKTRLIAGVRNSSYSPFSPAKLIFVDFLFSSKIKNMTLMLYVHTIIILGELYKS